MGPDSKKQRTARLIEWGTLLLVVVVLLLSAIFHIRQAALLTLVTALLASVPFFLHFERQRPRPRDIMPIVVMATIATVGNLLFAPIPSFKPVGAIVIITAIAFGRQSGYVTGALAAFSSNLLFGQGAWTPWQMFGWGLVGYLAGVCEEKGLFRRPLFVYIYAFMSGFLFGFLLDTWHIIGFVQPITWPSALVAYGAGLPMNATLAVATVLFLMPVLSPWTSKLERIKRKFGLMGVEGDVSHR